MAEINVTPMVDVMLVLLIVFMVAAPLLTVGVPVDLPKTQAAPLSGDNEPLTITLDGKGQIFIQETPVEADALVPRLLAIAQNGYEQRIFVRADSGINYGRVMDVMGRISSAGFTKVGLVTESDTSQTPKGDTK
jgi:biopolymer transport protein TolR